MSADRYVGAVDVQRLLRQSEKNSLFRNHTNTPAGAIHAQRRVCVAMPVIMDTPVINSIFHFYLMQAEPLYIQKTSHRNRESVLQCLSLIHFSFYLIAMLTQANYCTRRRPHTDLQHGFVFLQLRNLLVTGQPHGVQDGLVLRRFQLASGKFVAESTQLVVIFLLRLVYLRPTHNDCTFHQQSCTPEANAQRLHVSPAKLYT